MSLKELSLKGLYDSDKDNLLQDFYIPVLSHAVMYKRIAGFFSSNALAIAAKGISKFIENGGKIQLIANVILSEKDQDAIRTAIREKESQLICEIETLNDVLKKGHIRLLAWLVKNGKMEIKIAVVPKGIEHKKKGILEDAQGNMISFSGSDNETMKGWLENDEEFHVFCSWIEGDRKRHLEPDLASFDRLWNDETSDVRVFSVSDAFKRELIRTAPKDDAEFKEVSKIMTEHLIRHNEERIKKQRQVGVKFRDYQKEAIQNWLNNEYKGIFEMATATGKTITALGCLMEVYKRKEKIVTVIVCPYNHLITQWKKEIERLGIKEKIVIADSSNKKWKDDFSDNAEYVKRDYFKKFIIITTYKTFSSNEFIGAVSDLNTDLLLIADEMHWSGAETYRKGLIEKYQYRLGLSATPERYMDDAGSSLIITYFGKTIYRFDLKRAITEINPDTGNSYLTPYNYYPDFVELDAAEFDDYLVITKKMARVFLSKANKAKKEELLQRLAEERQRIIVNASQKIEAFIRLLEDLKQTKHILVYCSEKQIDRVQSILGEFGIVNHRFTGEEGTSSSAKYDGLSERDFLLKRFADGTYQVLVAMKCLDEGVDVPPARIAIILASSGNPKEYIQRRGRILRRHEGKERADIHDILVVPSLTGNIPEETKELEKSILLKEIKRYEEFAAIADNRLEALNKIFPIKRRYNLA
jgi:superfamily II DNA or RNA helicase